MDELNKELVAGKEAIAKLWSLIKAQAAINPNLLDNWYFVGGGSQQGEGQFPINQKGMTEYTTDGYSFDRWILRWSGIALEENGIRMRRIKYGAAGIKTSIENPQKLVGKTVTFSALIVENNAHGNIQMAIYYGMLPNSETFNSIGSMWIPAGEIGVFHITGTLPDIGEYTLMNPTIRFKNSDEDGDVVISAAKLELGDTQTLAHQDADGNWVLNEIPNYAEQYAICEQYSPITGEFVGSQHSNLNILDNWYFVGGGEQFPIDQRSEVEYSDIGVTIDRWFIGASLTVVLKADGVLVSNNGSASGISFYQRFEFNHMKEKQLTISFLTTDNELVAVSGIVPQEMPSGTVELCGMDSSFGRISISSISSLGLVQISAVVTHSHSVTLIAAKLELGPIQTLAHKEGDTWVLNDPPPNCTLELAKCQRYQFNFINPRLKNDQIIGTGVGRTKDYAYIYFSLPVSMRASPTVSLRDGDFLLSPDGSTANGIPVTDISLVDFSNNIGSLKVSASDLTVGKTYVLFCRGNSVKRNLLLDANL